MAVESWKQELDRKYEHLTNMGVVEVIDKANKVILKAIAELDIIRKEEGL